MAKIQLTAEDGHGLGAYEAVPDQAIGSVVVLQEIFGVNHHIRSICDRLASDGYHAVAPSLFDRQSPGFESGYSAEDVETARGFLKDLNWDHLMLDTEAAISHLKSSGQKVAVVGFCLGGSIAYLAATKGKVDCAVGYYGGQIARFADESPKIPTILHFGKNDQSIPMEAVEEIGRKQPQLPIHIYDAGHGFNCDERGSYDPENAKLSWSRTLDFLKSTFS